MKLKTLTGLMLAFLVSASIVDAQVIVSEKLHKLLHLLQEQGKGRVAAQEGQLRART